MQVIVDDKSGFCFGVKKAIELSEAELNKNSSLYCLGDIVHNEEEVDRLQKLGLKVIDREEFFSLRNATVLIRAHGEPPSTYNYAKKNKLTLIEGTCPVVLKLQQRMKKKYEELGDKGNIVIFGKAQHPEVIGLNGQVDNKAKIVQDKSDLDDIDFSKPVVLFSQTTMNRDRYHVLKAELEKRLKTPELLEAYDTICGQMANRAPWLKEFSKTVDAIVFVGGKKSSNSKVLYGHCKDTNPNSYFVSSVSESENLELSEFDKVGVCGATSTPQWLMENVADSIRRRYT
ncbi:MAG: 4-hydroxy-3-methylbut-2-enyl diphosphate reductase [Bacteroidales bacterium]|nr:4-hydroxy-3-methylbut-2-enyl diphosphate reductase [Bacteroidales bacterium]MBN2820318.1 4-hydroxy-3-methylbut-2-enyl diphosphate reductase [Bacteroidales bacterium]